ncbi:MAG TPA: HD domain-containing protein [Solirubrobacteraceae bacterium]|jgi:putative nucleotidyltransferase with HDIG domain|nr:HD domain-containing protein [Solirubrobacteraceae bacterium]
MTSSPLLPLLRGLPERAWLVGGAVRDELLERETTDFDLVVDADVRSVARALGRAADAHCFALSEAFGAWRVIARDRSWQIDLTPMLGASLEDDLAQRDLTINAMARRVHDAQLVDPHGGRADLEARRLRMVSAQAFRDDPLRVMRLARLAAQLEFDIDRATQEQTLKAAPALTGVAPERVFAELRQIVGGEDPVRGLRLLEAAGATAVVMPELLALQGMAQSVFHHLDVFDHTLDVLERTVQITRDPGRLFPEQAVELQAVLAEPLADELTRGQALRFGALFHDLAKSSTRGVTGEGRVTFIGHDTAGADLAVQILSRLRASERLASHVAALTRHHLRLGFLVHEMPLSRSAIYHYLRECQPVEVDVTLLSVADRLATRGRNSEVAIQKHLELAAQILPEALRWRSRPPRPPVRGDRLAQSLGITPGPRLGQLLEELTEAAFTGQVQGEADAVAWARERLAVTDPRAEPGRTPR